MNEDKFRALLKNEMARGISGRQLARNIGISFTSISNYVDSGTMPSVESLEKVAAYFHVPVGYFFDEEPEHYKIPLTGSDRINDIESRLKQIEERLLKKKDNPSRETG